VHLDVAAQGEGEGPAGEGEVIPLPHKARKGGMDMATIERLRRLVEEGKRERPELASRLERAAFILLLRPILKEGDGWRVGSEDGRRWHAIQGGRCSCQDFQHRGGPCKHLLALELLARLQEEKAQPQGDPAADLYPPTLEELLRARR